MPYYKISKTFALTGSDIYDIIMDIDSYPSFLPWCSSSRIISKENNIIIAELIINYKGFKGVYLSEIKTSVDNNNYKIDTKAISGPFKYLNNECEIISSEHNCRVDFLIDFEFKSFILNKLINSFFKTGVDKMLASFEQRAKILLTNKKVN